MVRYNQAYKGTTHVGCIIKNGKIVKKIYKGSELVYKLGFDTFTINAGTTNRAWTVPMGVEKIHIDCVASRGNNGKATAGNGGRVQCDMNVTGGQVLYITVGAIPSDPRVASYNASDIKIGGTSYNNRILVAGGGGSAGNGGNGGSWNGGAGGGTTGATGAGNAQYQGAMATGGTQSSGGSGGTHGSWFGNDGGNGSFGIGGNGGAEVPYGGIGGAGGAGWYGGGGGGSPGRAHWKSSAGNGGGGGSSYANTAYCSAVSHTQGYRNGDGYITISYVW